MYVVLDGAEEPKENDFWMAQRSALKLGNVGFATTTDVERALHPPDKQDVAARLLLEIRRIVYGEDVTSRGPEVVSSSYANNKLEITFSNATLEVHEVGQGCSASFWPFWGYGDWSRHVHCLNTLLMLVPGHRCGV